MHNHLLLCVLSIWLLAACSGTDSQIGENYKQLPAYQGDTLFVVVEIPAGTNHKIEYDRRSGEFRTDTLAGQERVIDFLPYPGNYGFIPATLVRPEAGGDGDALDALVIGEALPTGTVAAVLPIGALLLRDNGELDTKIITVPADAAQRAFQPTSFIDFMLDYDPARRIVEQWFLNYKGPGVMEFIRWEDDRYAWSEVRKWEDTTVAAD